MLNSLYKYLILHDHVALPGIGNFRIQESPASLDGNTITPPSKELAFSAGSALTDKQFYQYLAKENDISEVDAVRRFQDFAYQLRKDIQSNPQVTLKGFGIFKRNNSGEIIFEPTVSVAKYYSGITAVAIAKERATPQQQVVETEHGIETDPEEEVIRADRWWIWAVVLAIAALAIIGYFYMQGEII